MSNEEALIHNEAHFDQDVIRCCLHRSLHLWHSLVLKPNSEKANWNASSPSWNGQYFFK